MKRLYEVAFIVKPNVDEINVKQTIDKLKKIYLDGGANIVDEFDMGTRELAYEIQKNNSGYYYFLNVESESELNIEFERICRITEDVLRFMVISIKEPSLDILREQKK